MKDEDLRELALAPAVRPDQSALTTEEHEARVLKRLREKDGDAAAE